MRWTVQAIESYTELMKDTPRHSPIWLLTGEQAVTLRQELVRVPRNLSNADYVRWRNAKIVEILNTKEQ